MKCSIITIHHIHNFGSVFQAYSLYKFLLEQGYDTELIDYRPAYYDHGKNRLKTVVGKSLNLRHYLKRKKKFESFITTYDKLSPQRAVTEKELSSLYGEEAHVFIAGGDQLWNDYHPCGRDDAYKLTFARKGKKLSYGTSMGRDGFDSATLEALAEKTKDFSHVMLRESVNVPMLQAHTDVPVSHVIDPVGLLDVEEFKKIAKKPKIKEPYAVMYLADSGEVLNEAVAHLSKKLGLKIVHICGFKKKCACDLMEKDVGPEEILGYILHADFVLSASFHATMFSLLFGKPFATLLPGAKTNARIEDILKKVGLDNRIIHTKEELSVLDEHIDFTHANEVLGKFRESSRELLLRTIKETEEETK